MPWGGDLVGGQAGELAALGEGRVDETEGLLDEAVDRGPGRCALHASCRAWPCNSAKGSS